MTELEAEVLGLVAEFIGSITGLTPPKRETFPPQFRPALRKLVNDLVSAVDRHAQP